ncbi:MAG: hypothetical protein LCH79_19265 [Proteobacteria bacterium]|nr:hypothetical protein [Pseudomonadota bacterium]
MSSDVVKSVEVKDLGEGRYEISYKGAGHKIYQLFGAAILIVVALPAGCTALLAATARKGDGAIAVGLFLLAAFAVWLAFWFVRATHKIIVSPEKLEFGDKKIPFTEIDTVGYENARVYVVCSGTRVYLGYANNSDVAEAVFNRIQTYSKRSWS